MNDERMMVYTACLLKNSISHAAAVIELSSQIVSAGQLKPHAWKRVQKQFMKIHTTYQKQEQEILKQMAEETPTEQDNELRELVHMIQNADTAYDAMQLITDWHNKQVEEAIEATEKITADIEFKAGINHATMSGEYIHRDEVAKQTEELLDRLLEHGEDFTTFGDGRRSVAVEYIEAERNKLKESDKEANEQL